MDKLHLTGFHSRNFSTTKINYEIMTNKLLATIDVFKER
jgi:hypothetical protein